MSAESREVNRDVAHGNPGYDFLVGESGYDGHTGLFKINATALFPRAIAEDSGYFFMNVTFAIMLPANASYFSAYLVTADFSPGPNPNYELDESVAYGVEDFSLNGGVPVNGEPMGGTGIGFWNVTVWMGILWPPTIDISQNQSWLSFTSEAETHLGILLEGNGNMTAANGTNYRYGLSASFSFQGSPATFYVFGYPVAAWLGYASSILIGVASLLYLRRLPQKEIRKQFDSGV
jgi:hypothetical protein